MDFDFLKSAFQMAHIQFTENEPMAQKTTFKVGGTAALYVKPSTPAQLQSAIAGTCSSELPFFLLGGGSNTVFPDGTYNGVIISTSELNSISMTDDLPDNLAPNQVLVTCECGTPTTAFVNFCTKHNLSGAEQFAGLPGSIGGAVYMNARCFDKSISDILYETEQLEFTQPTKAKITTSKIDLTQWDYKKSPFQTQNQELKRYVVSATFVLTKMEEEAHAQIEEACKKYIYERVSKGHFKYPSAGSVFKNNHSFGSPSGKIIDEAGLRGYQIGQAQVAPFHGNFIINLGNAKASEIEELVKHVQKEIKEKKGFELEPEIIFLH